VSLANQEGLANEALWQCAIQMLAVQQGHRLRQSYRRNLFPPNSRRTASSTALGKRSTQIADRRASLPPFSRDWQLPAWRSAIRIQHLSEELEMEFMKKSIALVRRNSSAWSRYPYQRADYGCLCHAPQESYLWLVSDF